MNENKLRTRIRRILLEDIVIDEEMEELPITDDPVQKMNCTCTVVGEPEYSDQEAPLDKGVEQNGMFANESSKSRKKKI